MVKVEQVSVIGAAGHMSSVSGMHRKKVHSELQFVCHGGTIMSVLERYGRPEKSFYEWQIANGCGILTETIEEGGYHYGIREIGKWE